MRKDFKIYLYDILESIEKIQEYIEGMTFSDFYNDSKTIDAVVLNFAIMGEAVKKLPDEIQIRYPHVEWKDIAGLRDIIIHQYSAIDLEIIWDIVQNKLPVLKIRIDNMIKEGN
jgi:uncharacterized protein with HEPN domain